MNIFEKISLLIIVFILFICILILIIASKQEKIYKFKYPLLQDISNLQKIRQNNLEKISFEGSEQLYNISLNSVWSLKTHPYWTPLEPQILPFLSFSHKKDNNILQLGKVPDLGFEKYIEEGNTKLLINSILRSKKKNEIRSYTKGSKIHSPDIVDNILRVTKEHPYITFIAPIHPSPDWFIGVSNIQLYFPQTGWVEEIKIPVQIYDAGTDDGIDFTSNNINTKSSAGIQYLTIPSTLPIAYLTIRQAK